MPRTIKIKSELNGDIVEVAGVEKKEKKETKKKSNKVTQCSECKWFDKIYDAKGICRGHAPRVGRFQDENCAWALVLVTAKPCRLGEPKDE